MSPVRRIVAASLALLALAGFVALGTWQVHRRTWKLALIAAVETRVHAPPAAAPGPAAWPAIDAAHDAYRHVRVDGIYDGTRQTLVQASTDRGPGWWVMTPLRTPSGFVVLVNRGFVAGRGAPPSPAGSTSVTGLLRITEPGGGFLRSNDPAHDRWFSRDVAAVAHMRGIAPAAPYFVDADAGPERPGQPVGGLTVIRFTNNHLVYALTWYGLAIMSALAALFALRRPR